MTRQNIAVGLVANDGSGDTLRQAGNKINANFVELYRKLGGDSDVLSGEISVAAAGITFEGSTADDFETNLQAVDPTADRSITLPDASGSIVLDTATQTLTNKTLASSVLTTPQINDTSADHKYVVTPSELAGDVNVTLPVLSSNDTFVFANNVQTLTNKTLTNPEIDGPTLVNSINDNNGAAILDVSPVASAVNQVVLSNAATSNHPGLSTAGTDTNINLSLAGKGTGAATLEKGALGAQELTSNGTASDTASYIVCDKATTLFVTMDDGTTVGEFKIFTNRGAGDATVTPESFAHGTSFTLAQNVGCTVIWDGASWFLVGNQENVTIL